LGLPVAGVGLHVAVSNPSEGRANPLGPARSVGVDLLVAVSNPSRVGQILLGLPEAWGLICLLRSPTRLKPGKSSWACQGWGANKHCFYESFV